jgi:N-acetylneuraminate synthase
MNTTIRINGRTVGPQEKVYIVAEMSANHNHDFEQAVRILKAAKEAGADAVKLQTYTPDTITVPCDNKYFRIGENSLWSGRNLYELYREAFMPWEWQPKLKVIANELGIDLFSTAFDSSSVDFLEEMGVLIHKISSFEIVDIPLIEKAASTGKPLIISTGMATFEEIEEAIQAARGAGASQIALLKCTSAYPARPEDMNLRTLPHLAETFHVPIGISDHSLGIVASVAAVALGACIIEKHFTLSRSVSGPDSAFSLEPKELKSLVDSIRVAEKALGGVSYGPTEGDSANCSLRRSIFVVQDIKSGDAFTNENVRSILPGHGLHCRHLRDILGRHATVDIECGSPMRWSFVRD